MWGDGAVLVSGMPLGLTGDQQAAMQMLMERQQHLPRGASPDSSSSMFM